MEGDCTRVMLITANVGSIFEEPDTMFPVWMKHFLQTIQHHNPGLVALHCQEVGGKNYEASMQHVNQFIKKLLACEELHKYDRARIFLDEDYTASDKFTALGNLYFVHEDVPDVLIWDWVDCKFVEIEGREVLSGNIENVPIKEKAKFPQQFFPEFKWSRKGFLRTRWSINNCIFDLVNIHLFHDASNIIAMETSPSIYSANRHRAMLHTLQRFENDKYSKVPLFIFGDFNFRMDANTLITEITQKLMSSKTTGKKDIVSKIEYTEEENGKIVLTVGCKNFDYYEKHSEMFSKTNTRLHQYDNELSQFRDRLFEYDVSFPPSYPFAEDVNEGTSYMKTRVPSWCDRVLLTHTSRDIINQDISGSVIYDMMGQEVCMGDHKPIYLAIQMKPGKGNASSPVALCESPTSNLEPGFDRQRSRTLSINGELVGGVVFNQSNTDLSRVNIHDFAQFERESQLNPEFKASIKNKSNPALDSEGNSPSGSPRLSGGKRQRSFKKMAQKVCQMEKVLLKWPNRPRTHHHSSSSEDDAQEEESSEQKEKKRYVGVSPNNNNNNTASTDISTIEANNNQNSLVMADALKPQTQEGNLSSTKIEEIEFAEIELSDKKNQGGGAGSLSIESGDKVGCGDSVGVAHGDGCGVAVVTPGGVQGRPSSVLRKKKEKAGTGDKTSTPSLCCRCVVL